MAVQIDPGQGGWTNFIEGAPVHASPQPVAAYFVRPIFHETFSYSLLQHDQAAMVGSALLGSLLVFCGFNTLASKIVSFFIGLSFCAVSPKGPPV